MADVVNSVNLRDSDIRRLCECIDIFMTAEEPTIEDWGIECRKQWEHLVELRAYLLLVSEKIFLQAT
ncbi:hypothetical protein FACS1894217_14010 [Clostridia bacterium]|nr:hypothetical protein FACS1894217_14010 [Clostridia bacterium]